MASTRNYFAALTKLTLEETSSSASEDEDASRPRQPPAPSTLPTPSRLLQHVAGCAPHVADRPLACSAEPSTLQRAPNGSHAEQPGSAAAAAVHGPGDSAAAAARDGTPQCDDGFVGTATLQQILQAEIVVDPASLDPARLSAHLSRGQQQPDRGAPDLAGPRLAKPLVWLDLEMTGLNAATDTIIEIACLISDGSLEHVIEGPEVAIHHSNEVLAGMNEWCVEHHASSGLTERCRASQTTMAEAEAQVLGFLQRHVEPREARLAGNSVHVDLGFLRVHMPDLAAHLHYRIVDVSSVAELCARWFPTEYKRAPRKKAEHTAMADVHESLEQLRYYKGAIFKQKGGRGGR